MDAFRRLLIRPEKFGRYPRAADEPARLKDTVLNVLGRLAASGMSLEVNSSGLRPTDIGEPYPCRGILAWAGNFELTYVFGSDAHPVERVGEGYEETMATLTARQRERLVTYRQRRPVPVPGTGVEQERRSTR